MGFGLSNFSKSDCLSDLNINTKKTKVIIELTKWEAFIKLTVSISSGIKRIQIPINSKKRINKKVWKIAFCNFIFKCTPTFTALRGSEF